MYSQYLTRIEKILCKLKDDKSVKIMDTWIDYMFDGNRNILVERLFELGGEKFIAPEVAEALDNRRDVKIILFGCGNDGHINKKVLEKCGYNIYAFCDNAQIDNYEGEKVISVKEAVQVENAFFIISSRKYRYEMYEQLVVLGVDRKNILIPIMYDGLIAGFDVDNQYFDVFEPNEHEIFVDVGALDGTTTLNFKNWAGKEAVSYILEASELCAINIKNIMEKEKVINVIIINGAAWNENEELFFIEAGGAGHLSQGKGKKVNGVKLDDVIPEATFIKMDIEGAELQAIKGAENLIRKCKPRMAISVYHNPGDIIAIPAEILSIDDNYKFILRHYSTNRWETVLYAYT